MLKKFFDKKEKITGEEILSLCDVHQINLFVVRELFKSWRDETKKLKSSYFDYENEEVKEALSVFMSILSKHIHLSRQHFGPLIKKAVSQTLLVIFNPYDYFSMLVSGTNNRMDVITFKEEIKYLKINKAPLELLLKRLEEKKQDSISGNEAFAILDQILEEVNFTPEDVEGYLAKFSAVEKLTPERFYVKKSEVKPIPQAKTIDQNDKPRVTLHETIGSAPKQTVADKFQKIDRIKDRLTINQKFMFTKVLFNGDFENFSKTIDELDQQSDMPAALKFLEKHYEDWDKESEEFHEFMEMVEKRFS
jgi:hypothetical protein